MEEHKNNLVIEKINKLEEDFVKLKHDEPSAKTMLMFDTLKNTLENHVIQQSEDFKELKEGVQKVDSVFEKMGEILANVQGINRRLDITNGRIAKGEDRDEKFKDSITYFSQCEKDFQSEIKEINTKIDFHMEEFKSHNEVTIDEKQALSEVLEMSKWLKTNKKYVWVVMGILSAIGGLVGIYHTVVEDFYKK